MKVDQLFNEQNEEIQFDSGEIKVKNDDPENWEVKIYGVENQRFFMEGLRDNRKEHLTFETNKGTMNGIVDIETFDSASEENVVTMKGTSTLNGYKQ
ncbi:hypothetical protein [Alteribacillus sp. YIM 98480]|uniref:hypothetical protein n=1 Tax=Alteribacillus sp. YIM 98480 TaxID=2606599 RepID=UPI00131E1A79|nr:hypothetical protein [Alteribacillus sp. YIM 98480]